jgi:hypothetical protein
LSDELPYTLRWPKQREKLISCFCCPPNTLRTLCETQNYAYSLGKNEIYVNLYGSNSFNTKLEGIGELMISQQTDYPWDGNISLEITKLKGKKNFTFKLRLPAWCKNYRVEKNGQTIHSIEEKGYIAIEDTWKKGDKVVLNLEMNTRIMEANPLVEESRGQVAIQRGPIVYCAEGQDLGGIDIDDVIIPLNTTFKPVEMNIDGSRIMALEGEVMVREEASWTNTLYREALTKMQRKTIRLIPYYAWGNRGKSEMSVWLPAGY